MANEPDHHNLNIEEHGPETGPTVVLLHHGLGSVRAWKAQLPALAAAGFHVIAYDRWGYGDSAARKQISIPTFEEDLADLEALLKSKGICQANLVGHSDGGTIALYYSAFHPEQVSCLVVVAAHIYVEPKMEPGINGVRLVYEHDDRFREGLRRVHGDKLEDIFYAWYHGWLSERNLAWDMRPVLKKISCPTLVVQGIEDEHATPQHAKDLAAAIPGAELWLEPEAQHMLPQDIPEEFNRRVIEFLSIHSR